MLDKDNSRTEEDVYKDMVEYYRPTLYKGDDYWDTHTRDGIKRRSQASTSGISDVGYLWTFIGHSFLYHIFYSLPLTPPSSLWTVRTAVARTRIRTCRKGTIQMRKGAKLRMRQGTRHSSSFRWTVVRRPRQGKTGSKSSPPSASGR